MNSRDINSNSKMSKYHGYSKGEIKQIKKAGGVDNGKSRRKKKRKREKQKLSVRDL